MKRSTQALAFLKEIASTMTQKQATEALSEKFGYEKPSAAAIVSASKSKHSLVFMSKGAVAPTKSVVSPIEAAVVKPTEQKPVREAVINEIDISAVPLFLRKSWEKHA